MLRKQVTLLLLLACCLFTLSAAQFSQIPLSGQLSGTYVGPCRAISIPTVGIQFITQQFQFGQPGQVAQQQFYNQTVFLYSAVNCPPESLFGWTSLTGTFLMGPIGSATVDNDVGPGDPPANLQVTWGAKTFSSTTAFGILAFQQLCNITVTTFNTSTVSFQDQGCPQAGILNNTSCPNFYTVVQTAGNTIYLGQNQGLTSCTTSQRTVLLDPTPYSLGAGARVSFSGMLILAISTACLVTLLL